MAKVTYSEDSTYATLTSLREYAIDAIQTDDSREQAEKSKDIEAVSDALYLAGGVIVSLIRIADALEKIAACADSSGHFRAHDC